MIADEAAAESPLWDEALLDAGDRELVPVFSPLLGDARYDVGLETIYEGYLLHYGRPRLFAADGHSALLLGDYLYAHGLVRVAETGDVEAVGELAELISRCAQLRADGQEGDGEEWIRTSSSFGAQSAVPTSEAVETALAAHARLVG